MWKRWLLFPKWMIGGGLVHGGGTVAPVAGVEVAVVVGVAGLTAVTVVTEEVTGAVTEEVTGAVVEAMEEVVAVVEVEAIAKDPEMHPLVDPPSASAMVCSLYRSPHSSPEFH